MDTEVRPHSAARIRGTIAVRIVGELMTRLAGGERWDFGAFGRDDEVIVTGSSSPDAADVAVLRAECRLQRFGGTPLPHVGTSLTRTARESNGFSVNTPMRSPVRSSM
jgi:hypothetical protein